GEMADADYGYVGSGPGRITLYRGREVVRRNIPEGEAIEALVELINEDRK
ncbi:MAG: flavodoxin-dependent (E)-4-hydroxy-3-methylbut-2-enyl-diphosphate synthase, partial [Rikenellaceae bacterium]|nr:flavodoxin-dependent (E)-4-hydroxy-3-methylbut-2-enyl-diphosphate synthase [Rikenellaceae bacterium]